jgi:hypothetical protein
MQKENYEINDKSFFKMEKKENDYLIIGSDEEKKIFI